MVFAISMSNTFHDTVFYYEGLKCAAVKFEVLQNNVSFGKPNPDNWACTYDLVQENLEPNGVITTQINWLENPQNSPLPIGDYNIVFSSQLALGSPGDWKDIEETINFTVN